MKELVITKNEGGQRLDKFLGKLLKEAPKSFCYRMLRKKNITLNGKKAAGNEKLAAGDVVRLFLSEETIEKFAGEQSFRPVRQDLKILYEDDDILLVDKPAGMLSQKSRAKEDSLVEYLISYLLEEGEIRLEELATFRPSVCNRLDKNTSGIVACGKTLAGLQALSELFRTKTIRKYYCCLVAGDVKEGRLLTGYLQKSGRRNQVVLSPDAQSGGRPVETRYTPIGGNGRITVLQVELLTGKSHQIRSHLAGVGHPVIGDPKYGDSEINAYFHRKYGVKYQLLHGMRLEFPKLSGVLLPVSEKKFTAPLPETFLQVVTKELPGENINESFQRSLGVYQDDHHRGAGGDSD